MPDPPSRALGSGLGAQALASTVLGTVPEKALGPSP